MKKNIANKVKFFVKIWENSEKFQVLPPLFASGAGLYTNHTAHDILFGMSDGILQLAVPGTLFSPVGELRT